MRTSETVRVRTRTLHLPKADAVLTTSRQGELGELSGKSGEHSAGKKVFLYLPSAAFVRRFSQDWDEKSFPLPHFLLYNFLVVVILITM